jgi:staphylococcal nuclease domain-containing protein 1
VAGASGTGSVFNAVVIRILGPDLLMVESAKDKQERKLSLASVRGPKRQKNEAGLEVGYYSEAVEFLRSRLVGNTVQVTIDYVKPAEGEYESRDCATILNGSQNVAEAMVSRGLAQVIRHRRDDDNRSSKYDSLLVNFIESLRD